MGYATKDLIIGTVNELAISFVYYDRKNDEELPTGIIEKAVEDGEITIDEMVEAFRESLEAAIG